MKAWEFEAPLGADGTVQVPAAVSAQVPVGSHIRVLVLMPDAEDDEAEERDWKRLGLLGFFRDDCPEDAIYDRYDELSGRGSGSSALPVHDGCPEQSPSGTGTP